MSDEAKTTGEARKARSIARLHHEGVPTIQHLPWIEADPATVQAPEAIARRLMTIGLLAVYAEPDGMPKAVLDQYLDLRGVRGELTPKERAFVAMARPSTRDRGPFTWQYESANVLLWALGFVADLGPPIAYCTATSVSAEIAPRTVEELIAEAQPRSADELFDAADLIFRYHWAARDASLQGNPAPTGLLPPVCEYRHHALNWLTSAPIGWDEVDTST
jgi:hypothetical protein